MVFMQIREHLASEPHVPTGDQEDHCETNPSDSPMIDRLKLHATEHQ